MQPPLVLDEAGQFAARRRPPFGTSHVPALPPSRRTGGAADLAVLVVDDDPANAKLLDVVLRGAGWDVRVAGSAEAALEVLEDFRPRIMVLDLVLPSMSGLVLAERLQADPETRAIVLVAITALRGPGAERLALAAGCAACLESPVDMVALPSLLHARLEGAR